MRQVAAGATEVATGFILQCLDSFRSNMQEDFRLCTGDLQDERQSAAAFGPPGPVQQLMGQIQGLWERVGVHQNRIDALVKENEQVRGHCDQMVTAQTNAQREIGQLRATNKLLQKDNDHLRQELLSAKEAPRPSKPSSASFGSSAHSGLTERDRAIQLNDDNNRIRGEREALRQDNEKMRNTIAELKKNAHREKVRNDATIDRLLGKLQAA